MKNIYTKTAAFMLCIICGALMMYTACNVLCRYAESYDFAESFEESHIPHMHLLIGVSEGDDTAVEYYIKSGENIYTNTNIADKSYYENSLVNRIMEVSGDVETYFHQWSLSGGDYVYARLTDVKYKQLETEWIEAEKAVKSALNICIIYLVGTLIPLVYLFWTCGRKSGIDGVHMLLIDRMPTEIALGLLGLSALPFILAVYLFGTEFDAVQFRAQSDIFSKGMALAFALSCSLMLMFLLSLLRNLKNRTFLKQSIIFHVIRFMWRLFIRIVKKTFGFIKKTFAEIGRITKFIFRGNREILLMAAYSALLFILSAIFIARGGFITFLIIVGMCFIALRYVYRRISGFERVCEGARKIRGGDVGYVIPAGGDSRTDELADNINCMADGLRESVKREVQAERMKAELITNVSHDLKTPLTAIINYADLLSEQELTPAEANDYVAVIKKKGERLKKLTSDLFDISKAHNGAEGVNPERLDLALLMRQSLGELDESIQNSGLDFRVSIPENEVNITADGKKLSRVFENLIQNVLKYSMEKSRVYVNLSVKDSKVRAELKNISAYPMDFDGDYITERFVRGDKSRSSEGSGLGLAIAKSYTELCGGELEVTVDGDLFKVNVVFDVCE